MVLLDVAHRLAVWGEHRRNEAFFMFTPTQADYERLKIIDNWKFDVLKSRNHLLIDGLGACGGIM